MRLRLLIAGSVIVLLASCGSRGGSDTRPTITATLGSNAPIERLTAPPGTDAVAPPAETAAPETRPREQPADTAAPGTAPSNSVAPADNGGGTVWWPWVLGALVVIGAIVAMALRRRPDPSWQIRATTLLDEISQLTSHLAAIAPGGLQAVAQSDAMRLATLRATLRDLIGSAPDASRQMALSGLTAPIAVLHGAVDAIAMSADPSFQPAGASVSQLATQLHTASASVRVDLAIPR